MANPYDVLGVSKEASQEDIRRAYRRLAKQHHPDLNPGDREAERRFKEVSAAYALLSDPEKRARFDRGEIDAAGQERPQRTYYHDFAEGPGGERYAGGGPFAGAEDLEDVFADLFGGFGRGGRVRARGADVSYLLRIDFLDAVKGGRRRVTLADGRTLDVDVPPGIRDGQTIRLRGQGAPGLGGGPPGDARIRVEVAPHPFFRREGNDVHLEVPVTIAEAVLGAQVRVPTVDGPVSVTIPKGSNSGKVLRLRGKGIPDAGPNHRRGDQYVTLRVVLPDQPDAELEAFLRDWAPRHPYDPRRSMEEAT